MGTTPTYALRYPEATDVADVPVDMHELALDAEAMGGTLKSQIDALAAQVAAIPGSELGYAEKTSATSLAGVTTEATAIIIASLAPITFDGATKVLVECFSPTLQTASAAGSAIVCQLWDGATCLGHVGYASTGSASSNSYPMRGARRLTPSAGAHTFHFKAYQQGVTGTVVQGGTGGPGAYMPAYIRAIRG